MLSKSSATDRSAKVAGLHRLAALGLEVPAFVDLHVDEWLPEIRPDDLAAAVQRQICQLGPSDHGYSVRSAAPSEDAAHSSQAGRFKSINGLVLPIQVLRAVRYVLAHQQAVTGRREAAVILQKTFSCYLGGVAFIDADGPRPTIVIETMFGSCRNVVDGTVEAFRSIYEQGSFRHKFSTSMPGASLLTCFRDNFANGTALFEPGLPLVPKAVPFLESPRLFLPPDTLEWLVFGHRPAEPPSWYETRICEALVALSQDLPELRGSDIEWGCCEEGRIRFFQARPITVPIAALVAGCQKRQDTDAGAVKSGTVLYGTPAAPGSFVGRIVRPEAFPGQGGPTGESPVLSLFQISEADYSQIEHCGAVVSMVGGMLSHVSILCRELGKPCVAGIVEPIEDGTLVEVDGSEGMVRILEGGNSLLAGRAEP